MALLLHVKQENTTENVPQFFGILRSRETEGAYTLCNGMGGTGEHYAKWNKPGAEGQIPYDLTFNWNINKRK